jgi:hypothetical protein
MMWKRRLVLVLAGAIFYRGDWHAQCGEGAIGDVYPGRIPPRATTRFLAGCVECFQMLAASISNLNISDAVLQRYLYLCAPCLF